MTLQKSHKLTHIRRSQVIRPNTMIFISLSLLACFVNARAAAALITSSSFITTSSLNGIVPLTRLNRHSPPFLFAASNQIDPSDSKPKSGRERGIYSRPSAAIERGSGFFIPGLEGPRIRLVFGLTVITASAANHFLAESQPGDAGQIIAESLAAVYGTLLLLQGIIESGVQRTSRGFDASVGANDDIIGTNQSRNAEIISIFLLSNEKVLKSMQRVASTIINFTPATYAAFAGKDVGVLYSLGASIDGAPSVTTDEQRKLINLAVDAVSESRGGRVALPSEHPVSKLVPPSATRCILVQKLRGYSKDEACLVIGSNGLLPSFTKNDLRWIGQLADTVILL